MKKKLNGIKLDPRKNTENCETVQCPIPERVKFPMLMHIGVPCNPIIEVGDIVNVGQKIGDSDSPFSVPIHSSVSGKVISLNDYKTLEGIICKIVEVETNGLQEISEEVKPHVITDKESFIKGVRESGICGLGGAGFPTHIKLLNKDIDTLIINAAECEPYINADYREMIENTNDIINGIRMIQDFLRIKNAKISVEDNKPEAIKKFQKIIKNEDAIDIITLPHVYPQGAEKVIIYNTTGRIVKEGTLPANEGIIVLNVSTVASIYRYTQNGMPFVTRRITVDGNAVGEPKNVRAVIGTPFIDVLKFCKTDVNSVKELISGGPMMGVSIPDMEMPVTKTVNAILAFDYCYKRNTTSCIHCGRCVNVCPLGLMPVEIDKAYKINDVEDLKALKVMLCMNCGNCTYVCPANRPLAETNQLAKTLITRK